MSASIHRVIGAWFIVAAVAIGLAPAALGNECDTEGDGLVKVKVDMNPDISGCQSFVLVPVGAESVEGIAVYVFDPEGVAQVWDIGYIGGLNRGIALGHAPSDEALGVVTAMTGTPIVPVHPGNIGWVEPGYDPMFAGPEVQYVEGGESNEPATIPIDPAGPIFTADVELDGAEQGDVFRFYVADRVTRWFEGHGSFSTTGRQTLDSGGDVNPDGTDTLFGVDGDEPVPVPPATYYVDFVDGEGGARVVVVVFGDGNFDGRIDLYDFELFQECVTGPDGGPVDEACAVFDFDNNGTVDFGDFGALQLAFTVP